MHGRLGKHVVRQHNKFRIAHIHNITIKFVPQRMTGNTRRQSQLTTYKVLFHSSWPKLERTLAPPHMSDRRPIQLGNPVRYGSKKQSVTPILAYIRDLRCNVHENRPHLAGTCDVDCDNAPSWGYFTVLLSLTVSFWRFG